MQNFLRTGDDPDIVEKLHNIVDRMLERFGKTSPRSNTLLGRSAPIDISRPNQHDSKAEFSRELKAVKECLDHIEGIMVLLASSREDEAQKEMQTRLSGVVDEKMRNSARSILLDGALSLVRRNVADVGGYYGSLYVFMDLRSALSDRFAELKEQEDKFWNLSHRAPDYYARAIALRLAKLYAREAGERPTVGTSGETGDPSTGYTRALEEVFQVLGIRSNVRAQAEWAVSKLTEDDLEPQETIGSLLGQGLSPYRANALSSLMAGSAEKRSKD